MNTPGQDQALAHLLRGEAPGPGAILDGITVGLESLTDFLSDQYLREFIPLGGSKIKFATGRPGCGKTHFSQVMLDQAKALGYLTAGFSARTVWLHDFREIYLNILEQCGIERVLRDCADQITRDLGYDPSQIGKGQKLMDYLSERGEGDAMHPTLEPASRDLILAFMNGDKSVRLAQLRALGLSPTSVTRYNARHLLRSLAEVVHLGGHPGLLIVIDDMEALLNRAQSEAIRYTKLRREDTYESIRQLIDDIDSMHYVMFLMCFDRALMDDESYGMKSYQALWMRIQSEVVSTRFNRFADIIDLDRYADEYYTAPLLAEMSKKLADVLAESGYAATPLTEAAAQEIIERGQYGGLGLPYLMNRQLVEGGAQND